MRLSIPKFSALITVLPAVLLGPAEAVAPPPASIVSTQDLTADILDLTNKQRALHGCGPVHADARLAAASTAHSVYMAQTGAFSHTGPASSDFLYRIKAAQYPRPLAENIAYGFRTGVEVVVAWMNSPEHRANLLNCNATAVGVGAAYAADGTPYFTEDFGD
jgi:uncharacterized protein YkwD